MGGLQSIVGALAVQAGGLVDLSGGPQGTLDLGQLAIDPIGLMDTGRTRLQVDGNVEPVLDAWIADGRLYSSSCSHLDAIYLPLEGYTRVVPEPATLGLLALGGLAVMRRRWKA
jgi:hypothetical protein